MNGLRKLWPLLLVMVVGVATLASWRALVPHENRRLVAEGYAQVRNGMTQAEVEELLGGPPGDYGRHRYGNSMMTCEGYISPSNATELLWYDDDHRFEIYFNSDGQVVGFHQRACFHREPASLWNDLRVALGLQPWLTLEYLDRTEVLH